MGLAGPANVPKRKALKYQEAVGDCLPKGWSPHSANIAGTVFSGFCASHS